MTNYGLTWAGWYETPNVRRITSVTRPQVQMSPRKPKASAPCSSNSGIWARCSAVSLGVGPGARRVRSASRPPSRPRFSHWLTAPSNGMIIQPSSHKGKAIKLLGAPPLYQELSLKVCSAPATLQRIRNGTNFSFTPPFIFKSSRTYLVRIVSSSNQLTREFPEMR
jgi:hypothetical protein